MRIEDVTNVPMHGITKIYKLDMHCLWHRGKVTLRRKNLSDFSDEIMQKKILSLTSCY